MNRPRLPAVLVLLRSALPFWVRFALPFWVLALIPVAVAPGCATLQEIAALRRVDFELDRVTRGDLAGVDLERYRAGGGLSPVDAGRVAVALGRGELPLRFNLHV